MQRVALKTLKNWLPILTAFVSAMGVLIGYVVGSYDKQLERASELGKTRQEIYTRLINNITERNEWLGRLELLPEYSRASGEERIQLERKNPELSKINGERFAVVAQLVLYGTDEAIDAYAKYASLKRTRWERRAISVSSLWH